MLKIRLTARMRDAFMRQLQTIICDGRRSNIRSRQVFSRNNFVTRRNWVLYGPGETANPLAGNSRRMAAYNRLQGVAGDII